MTESKSTSRYPTPEVNSSPVGWFVLEVMRIETGKWDWVALMIDVDPDDLKKRSLWRTVRQCLVRLGKHRSRDSAWECLDDMMATRH
jgi:hypothetical protein